METQRLRVKIGPHEFEAEGPPDTVSKQYADWREMIASLPAATTQSAPPAIPPGTQLFPPSVTMSPPQPQQARVIMSDGPPQVLLESQVPDIFISDTKRGIV